MIKKQVALFILRWLISTAAMWLCIETFGTINPAAEHIWTFILAGLIFSLANAVIKPILTILALPLILLTMGIFVVILNAAMVGITVWLLPDVEMTIGGAILSCIIISVINYLVDLLVPTYNKK